MSRPLFNKTGDELALAIQQNRRNLAELLLIQSELRHRTTQRAKELGRIVDQRIKECDVPDVLKKPAKPQAPERDDAPILIGIERAEKLTKPVVEIDEEMRDQTYRDVATLRAKLLDLTRRSSLISFKHSGTSATILRVVDERPDHLFHTIGDKGMGFEPLPDEEVIPLDEQTPEFGLALERARLTDEIYLAETEGLGDDEADAQKFEKAERELRARVREALGLPKLEFGKGLDVLALARAHGIDPSYDLKADGDLEPHHEDELLRVLLTPKQLEKRLKSIWDKYRLHMRETGLHTLFLAMGFVEWFDEQAGTNAQFAPALILPVELVREQKRGRYEYMLRTHDEGLQINVALAEKMRLHWGLAMPELEEGDTPESYFTRLSEVLAQGQKLRLRRFVTLCVLPQMVLWKDLDPEIWPEDAFAEHPLLPRLLGAAPMGGEPSPSEPYDIDSNEWSEKAPALIRPADASQHSVLIEVAQGADLSVEGPPGTGKSETITNMIATAVAAGKKVLFVAEKQAALRVVADRLRESGLGTLLLELHGETTKRGDFYNSLRERLDARSAVDLAKLQTRRRDLQSRREMIRSYLALLDTPLGALGRTAYQLVWRDIALRDGFDEYVRLNFKELVSLDEAGAIDETQITDIRTQLDVFGRAIFKLDQGRDHRTLWLNVARLPVFGQDDQIELARIAHESATKRVATMKALAAIGPLNSARVGEDAGPFLAQLQNLTPFDQLADTHVTAVLREAEIVRTALQKQTRWRQLETRLSGDLASPAEITPGSVEELGQALSGVADVPATAQDVARRLDQYKSAIALEGGSKAAKHSLTRRFTCQRI